MRIHTEKTISSAHRLINPDFSHEKNLETYGKCYKSEHGHNWVIVVDIYGEPDKETGMILNFDKIKKVIDYLDHKNLNKIPELENIIPTSENLVQYILFRLNDFILLDSIKGAKVRIYESKDSFAEAIIGEIE